ncbi:MAG: hypothetical protein ACYTFI_10680 [Planctomycetota bacterium]|jgi:hypothetical protein
MDWHGVREFEGELASAGLEFDMRETPPNALVFVRTKNDKNLQLRIAVPGPGVAQIILVAPNPGVAFGAFGREAESACKAMAKVWPKVKTVVHREVTIRHLYDAEGKHAFKFLWEKRLGQKSEDLSVFGRVLGGGIRLVVPPTRQQPTQLNIRVESYLKDSRKIFVEVQCHWPSPVPIEEGLKPQELLDEADKVIDKKVVKFIRMSD